ncbi:hypothetical protein NYA30BAC_04346 (plasmid) [Halomonas sp. NYA30]|jgi:hypothetical protein
MSHLAQLAILIAILAVPIIGGLYLKHRYERKHGPIR